MIDENSTWVMVDENSPSVFNTKEEVLEAVKQNGRALCGASAELRGDRGVVLAAVKTYGINREILIRDY